MGRLGQCSVGDGNPYWIAAEPNGRRAGPYGGESCCLGALVGPLKVPTGGRPMQKESPVALVRHDPEMTWSTTRGRSVLVEFLTFAKRA